MGIYQRNDSPFHWMYLPRPGIRGLSVSTGIPIDGGTTAQTRRNVQLAQALFAARLGDLVRDRYDLGVDLAPLTFKAHRAWYFEHETSKKRSITKEASILRQLGKYFDHLSLSNGLGSDVLTSTKVKEWLTERVKAVAPATVNREKETLSHMLGCLVPARLKVNPCAGIKDLGTDDREARVLTDDEEDRIIAAATLEERTIIVMALDTLQRLTTVAASHENQDHQKYLTVLHAKGKGKVKPYKVPISSRLRELLDTLKPAAGGYYFPSVYPCPKRVMCACATKSRPCDRCSAWSRNRMIRLFEEVCDRAHVAHGRADGGMTFHCLRHTGASRMLNRGVDPKTVAEIGNWSDMRVLQRYLHPDDETRTRAVEMPGLRRVYAEAVSK